MAITREGGLFDLAELFRGRAEWVVVGATVPEVPRSLSTIVETTGPGPITVEWVTLDGIFSIVASVTVVANVTVRV